MNSPELIFIRHYSGLIKPDTLILDNTIDYRGEYEDKTSEQTAYLDIKPKDILLPVWMSAYNFKGKVYQFMVKAKIGEVYLYKINA